MTSPVQTERAGNIFLIGMNAPPVNALGHPLREALAAAFDEARDDDAIEVVLLYGIGRMFCAGADISEFGEGKHLTPPRLADLIDKLAALGKPSVAAIHGAALGGGLELALGCSVRVAMPGTRMGLSEINLGFIPGAGGTQRLPRVLSVEAAARMILNGQPIGPKAALENGLVSAALDGSDPREAGLGWLKSQDISSFGLPLQPDAPPVEAPGNLRAALSDEVKRIARTVGKSAPEGALKAVEAACTLKLAEGLEREREIFATLVNTDEAASLRHAFFAERQAGKLDDAPEPRAIRRVGIVGGGTMGTGIGLACLNGGAEVILREVDDAGAGRARERMAKQLRTDAERGRIDDRGLEDRLGRLSVTTDFAAFADLDLVIEAVFEEMPLKLSVFEELSGAVSEDCVLATNTSYLDIDEMAKVVRRPERMLGMHFFSPAQIMRLVEVIQAGKTSPEILSTAIAFSRKLGKVPVVAKVCHGFIGNRMLDNYFTEAKLLVEEGATPVKVDAAMTDFGFAMGPLAVEDLAGLDVNWRMRKATEWPTDRPYPTTADRLCEMNRFGQKTGSGWFRYEAGDRRPQPDEEVVRIARDAAAARGVTQRNVPDEEIVERCMLQLINTGAELLAEGIAARASDIDAVYLHGYGFPRWRGGPMFYASRRGWDGIRKRLDHYAATLGDYWRPAPAIVLAADEGLAIDEAAAKAGNRL